MVLPVFLRKFTPTLLLLLSNIVMMACPVCEKQQPKVLRGITHGAGPQDNWDYLIVWSMVVIVAITLIWSLKLLLLPGEKSNNHIKRYILNGEKYGQ